jgi:tryptophan-rich sensory protein
MNRYLSLAVWIAVFLGVSYGLGELTRDQISSWYETLAKPTGTPPDWAFPVMWTTLYIMIAAAGWKLWQENAPRELKALYVAYVVLNWLWTPVFFTLHAILGGLIVIVFLNLTALLFVIRTWKTVPLSAWLMVPPLLWTLYAMYLNAGIYFLNSGETL